MRHYLMIYEPNWAGPVANKVSGPDELLIFGEKNINSLNGFKYLLEVDKNAKNPLDFPPQDWHDPPSGQPLFSRKFCNLLSLNGIDNIDYYPVDVIYQPTGENFDYSIVNIIGLVAAVDRSNSEFIEDEEGKIEDLSRIILDEKAIVNFHIFRLAESPNLIIISEKIKNIIQSNALTGITILQDEEWDCTFV